MNVCILSGELARNAVIYGNQDKVMAFTVVTKYGFNATENKERVAFVPCVMFNPPLDLVKTLSEKGKGIWLEFEGRVSSSSYEADGERKFKTEVVVKNGTLTMQK